VAAMTAGPPLHSAMSQQNVEVVRRSWEAFNRGGLDAIEEFWHPDIEWRAAEGEVDDFGVFRGRDTMRRYYGDWLETFDEWHAEVEEIVFHDEERVVALIHSSARGRTSGVRTEGRYAIVYTVRGDQIVSGREYGTRDQALEAVSTAGGEGSPA
jgi:ketosteroid isomerase-like protein